MGMEASSRALVGLRDDARKLTMESLRVAPVMDVKAVAFQVLAMTGDLAKIEDPCRRVEKRGSR